MPASERETDAAHLAAAQQLRLHEIVREERMDILAVIAKGDNKERAARQRHIEDVERDLRAEFRREVIELREEVGELVAELHTHVDRKVNDLREETAAVMLALHARVEREEELRDKGDAMVLGMVTGLPSDTA